VGRGRSGLVGDGEGDGTPWVDGSRETQREEAVGFAENAGSYVGERCCKGWSVWVRGGGLASSKESALGTLEGGRPLFTWRGDPTRDLLRGGRLACLLLVLAAQAGARGSLSIGGGGDVFWLEVAGGEGGNVICASSVFPSLVAVGEQPHVPLGVAESLAKLGVVEWDEVFRVLCRGGGWCGWCSGPFCSLPGGAGAWGDKGGVGCIGGGRRLGRGPGQGLTHDVTGREWMPGGQPALGGGFGLEWGGGWLVARRRRGAPP